jgi:hypothetical protein
MVMFLSMNGLKIYSMAKSPEYCPVLGGFFYGVVVSVGVGVGVGVGVEVAAAVAAVVAVLVALPITITTVSASPKYMPEAVDIRHVPWIVPVLFVGAVIATESWVVLPMGTA